MIDAHQHFWRRGAAQQPWLTPAHHGIDRDFTPADLVDAAARAGVRGTVLVQSVDEPAENDRLARFAEESALVRGVVGWLPLLDPGRARREWQRLRIDALVGIRCLIGRELLSEPPSDDTMRLFGELADAGLAWDVVPLTAAQCATVAAIAREHPGLRIVIDHLARPPLTGEATDAWSANLRRLADHDGIAIKLSVGLDVLTGWTWDAAQLAPHVAEAIAVFGPDRCMLASNWPVSTLQVDYVTAVGTVAGLVRELVGAADHDRIVSGTATDWYRLDREAGR